MVDRSSWLRVSIAPYLASRALIVGTVVAGLILLEDSSPTPTELVTSTWDGPWYLSIAEHGYLADPSVRPPPPAGADLRMDGAIAYFPLYPSILWLLTTILPVPLPTLAMATSFVLGAAAVAAFSRLSTEIVSDEVARRSVYLFCFFPGAFILSLAYPEGLFIALAASCLVALLHRSWVVAGTLAALASATRPNGVALFLSCLLASWAAVRRDRDRRSLVAPLLASVGFIGFLGFLWARTGDPWYWFRANRRFWHDELGGWPELDVLLGGSHPQVSAGGTDRIFLLAGLLAGFALLLFLSILLVRARLPLPVTAFAFSYEGLALLNQALAPRPRLIFTAFPLVIGLAVWVRDRAYELVLAASAGGMVLLFLFYTVPWFQGRALVAP